MEKYIEVDDVVANAVLYIPIDKIGFPSRIVNALIDAFSWNKEAKFAKIRNKYRKRYVEDYNRRKMFGAVPVIELLEFTEDDLLKVYNFGEGSLQDIRNVFDKYKIEWRG